MNPQITARSPTLIPTLVAAVPLRHFCAHAKESSGGSEVSAKQTAAFRTFLLRDTKETFFHKRGGALMGSNDSKRPSIAAAAQCHPRNCTSKARHRHPDR